MTPTAVRPTVWAVAVKTRWCGARLGHALASPAAMIRSRPPRHRLRLPSRTRRRRRPSTPATDPTDHRRPTSAADPARRPPATDPAATDPPPPATVPPRSATCWTWVTPRAPDLRRLRAGRVRRHPAVVERAVPGRLRRSVPATGRRGVRRLSRTDRPHPRLRRRRGDVVRRDQPVRRVLLRAGRLHGLRRRHGRCALPPGRPVGPAHPRRRPRPRVRPRHPGADRRSRPRTADDHDRATGRLLRRRVGGPGGAWRGRRCLVLRRRCAQRVGRHDHGS